jgi:NtrC-family two-component system sensor histidine kinase KinB
MLSGMMESRLTENESELFSLCISSGEALLSMVNDLLDISQLEEHTLVLRRRSTVVATMVDLAMSQVAMLMRRKRLTARIDIPQLVPDIVVDRDRVVRVLVNLLGNAIRHSRSGDVIAVSAEYHPDRQEVTMSVSDMGEGIPEEYQSRIFDKFVQVEPNRPRCRTSCGLGLAFCKLVAEAHGGAISVESKPEEGSTFTLTFPLL